MRNPPKSHIRHKRRNLVSFEKAQTGDVSTGQIAGGDINAGINPDAVLKLLQDALLDERQSRRLIVAAIEQVDEHITAFYEVNMRLLMLTIALLVAVICLVLWLLVLVFVM